ncbi:putative disease resistance protein RGA3 [Dendrobium catenatum]|uniref:putative disease resistance protein RGA3 n=1 Tax=Dendrobium catenatum TaxID=906689 RepID=UPI00109F08D1|nr:putative disease resistance protein RGA3 [Dendrobium catenatum]
MAEMFLDPIMEKLINAGLRYLKDQFRWKRRTKENLEKLKEILPRIKAVVHFASSQEQITEQNPALNEWLWQLRDAIDDADDVLDELEYMELEKQVTKNKKLRRVRSIMKSMKKRLVKIIKRALKIDPNLKRLEEAVQNLHKVSTTGVDTFLHLVKDAKQELQKQQLKQYRARETGSSPKNDLIGRGKEKELVMEWLRNPSNEPRGTDLYRNITLLSIVGHGGMGKTTLLQHVYKDEITKEFDLKMWVCVSNNFDVKKVVEDMLESLKKERPRLETLEALQGRLEEEVMSKKFLLVLDDIWEEDEEKDKSKWENVLAPLASGGFGSKILVTTRTDSIALMFAKVIKKKKEIVKLEGLEEDECLQLLNSHAFAGVENRPDDHKKLRAISGEIVKKLLRSPLTAKVIGGVLNDNLNEGHWMTVLESNLLDQNSIHSILRLSYIVLPNHLQNCFAFCCMFPEDHEFDKDDLVRMWIALGFIQPSQEMTMEDIGGRYFDVLVKKTLFDKVDDNYYTGYYYKMHDLIHESASKFFAHVCSKLVDDEELSFKIPETLRHLSVQTTNPNFLRKIEKFKHLRSLFLFCEDSNQDICNALIKMLKASRSLRLLYLLRPEHLEIISEEIGNLIHLRYLKIDGYDCTMLPRSLSNLYHLQYIICDDLHSADFLPSDINNLSNLRYVKFFGDYISSICGIGKLKYLTELDNFVVRDVSGYRIGELENMNDLRILGIYNLENVKDAEEACSVKLCAKSRLTDLTLGWGWDDTDLWNIYLCEKVLDNLQPPKCLRVLWINRYMGARPALWMNNVSLTSNLEQIILKYCSNWETLPPFGQLPFLKTLTLYNMPKVKWLQSKYNGNDKYRTFPLLKDLEIRKCHPELYERYREDGGSDRHKIAHIPNIHISTGY